jgi:hypothetical protein
VTHSSYKSLLVAFAITALGVSGAAGCAIAPEGETTQESSSDLTIEHGELQPRIQPTTVNTVAPNAQQNAVVHPAAPRALGLDGPKPNPWDDGTNTNAGSTGGSGTSQNSK